MSDENRNDDDRGHWSRLAILILLPIILFIAVFPLGLFNEEEPEPVAVEDSLRQRAISDIRGLAVALHLFKRDCGSFPLTAQGLEVLLSGHGGDGICANFYREGYFPEIPTDPWEHAYIFTSDGLTFLIKSLGADGVEGGAGDDADIDNASDSWLETWSRQGAGIEDTELPPGVPGIPAPPAGDSMARGRI